jgi:hypothetical protein
MDWRVIRTAQRDAVCCTGCDDGLFERRVAFV